jgi:hypothetical protein
VKYMILTYGSQQDYDGLAGRSAPGAPAWTPEEFAALGAFMQAFNAELEETGELVETRGLAAPVHSRRLQLKEGVPVVTDGIVECDSFDRATEIAAKLSACPGPVQAAGRELVDVRPIMESQADVGL